MALPLLSLQRMRRDYLVCAHCNGKILAWDTVVISEEWTENDECIEKHYCLACYELPEVKQKLYAIMDSNPDNSVRMYQLH